MALLTVDDLARDLKVKNEDLLKELVTMGYEVDSPESPLETDDPAALRERLETALPRREVIEKRIKPTVIRRRVKSKGPMEVELSQAIKPELEAVAEPALETGELSRPEPAAEPSIIDSEIQGTRLKAVPVARKAVKKPKKTEAARIIERPAAPPQHSKSAVEPVSPPTTKEFQPKAEPSGIISPVPRPEPAAPSEGEPIVRIPEHEAQPYSVHPPRAAVEPAIAEAQEPAIEAGPDEIEEPGVGELEKGAEEKPHKKRKKKERRTTQAKIIGKVDLKDLRKDLRKEIHRVVEPEPEVEVEEKRTPVHLRAERPERAERFERGERPGRGERPERGERFERGERPVRPVRPLIQTPIQELVQDEEKRKKRKKDKKTREVEDQTEEESGKVRRRKEVLLRDDIYDERSRYGRLRAKGKKARPRKTEITTPKASKRRVKLPELVIVSDLAHRMSVKAVEVVRHLLALGVAAGMNDRIDLETATIVASEFGFEAEATDKTEQELLSIDKKDTEESLVTRPPVITVMGHVDHGKTSLLDYIRSTRVIDQEAGGITQHIGAYKIKLDRGEIVFLDTPGHEAFTAMRARGAQVTDFVVLVVAADDGVKEQTREAVNHAKAAKVPIVVAVNKIDKPEADRDRVVRELSELDLIPEQWGGDTLFTFVSAKTGEGIEGFLDTIILQAELMELKANPNKKALGTVIEARLDKGRGPVATVLVREGTLELGDAFVAGVSFGKVRAMLDDSGKSAKEAGPATPVEVQGFSTVPDAGESLIVVEEERMARHIGSVRQQKLKRKETGASGPVSLEDILARMKQEEESKEINLIIKADVQGSVEALKDALLRLSTQEVQVKVIHEGVGAVTESDVMLASASGAMIVGFNVRPSPKTAQTADEQRVQIRLYTVIYEAIEDIRKAAQNLLAPIEKETILGRAEVRQTFTIPKVGTIAGCYVTSGKIQRSNPVRLLRDQVVVYEGKISSMRRFKEDAREVSEGYECGIALENYRDIKIGDVIEGFIVEKEAAELS